MKIYSENNASPTFQAKVSERFIKSMRGYVNHGENRLQNNYKLSKKLEEYAHFGYDNYTIEMEQTNGVFGFEYKLFAVKDGDSIDKGILINKKSINSYKNIFKRFMTLNKHDFVCIMRSRLNNKNP